MEIKQVTQVGNKCIRSRALEVSKPTSAATQKVVTNLIDSMRYHALVGMAAPQIGKELRIFVTEIRKPKNKKIVRELDPVRVFINPRIISFSKKQTKGWEGCGSVAFANLFGMVERPTSVVVEAQDQEGTTFTLKAKDLLARIIQHEIDHLNGIVFVDTADTKTYMSKNEYRKL
jgi:peptide deformylase